MLKELALKVLEVAVLEVAVVAVVVTGERIGNAAVQEVQDTLQVHVWMCLTSLQCLRVGLSHYHHPLLLMVLLVTNATETVLLSTTTLAVNKSCHGPSTMTIRMA